MVQFILDAFGDVRAFDRNARLDADLQECLGWLNGKSVSETNHAVPRNGREGN